MILKKFESNNFKFEELFNGVFVIRPRIRSDERGYFNRMFCLDEMSCLLDGSQIVNVNHSVSVRKGTLRGLHMQINGFEEEKFVCCTSGEINDYVVDLNPDSKSYLEWTCVNLSASEEALIYIPKGFGHGFHTLMDNSEIIYFVTQRYSAENECSIDFFDEQIGIELVSSVTAVSDKDRCGMSIDDYEMIL